MIEMKRLLILLATFLLLFSFAACKARGEEDIEPETRQKGARENVEIKENPHIPPENLISGSESAEPNFFANFTLASTCGTM